MPPQKKIGKSKNSIRNKYKTLGTDPQHFGQTRDTLGWIRSTWGRIRNTWDGPPSHPAPSPSHPRPYLHPATFYWIHHSGGLIPSIYVAFQVESRGFSPLHLVRPGPPYLVQSCPGPGMGGRDWTGWVGGRADWTGWGVGRTGYPEPPDPLMMIIVTIATKMTIRMIMLAVMQIRTVKWSTSYRSMTLKIRCWWTTRSKSQKKKNKAGHILKFIKQLIAQKQKTNRIWSTSSNEYLPK